jgi:predicted molibdopterin-dependent oxidoreductase YjgC
VVLDTDQRETAQYADVVLPVATHAESDGSFTNHAGRVQRFQAAVKPAGEARPGWLVLAELLADVTHGALPSAPDDVFAALAAEGGAFSGLAYDALGSHGAVARV